MSALDVVPVSDAHHDAIVRMVAGRLAALRAVVPAVPDRLTRHDVLHEALRPILRPETALAAVRGGAVAGFMAWHETESHRGTGRPGAWVPAHGAAVHRAEHAPDQVYEALYEAATHAWAATGRAVLSASVLRGHEREHDMWITNGFGRFLHDAVISLPAARAPRPAGMTVRRAGQSDVEALACLEREHAAHYAEPPVFMVPPEPPTCDELRAFLDREPNTIWVAEDEGGLQGFLRFEPVSDGATEVLVAPTTISITGAFTRPAVRGRHVADAVLLSAMAHYTAAGFERVAMDHETTNPPARRFWWSRSQLVAVSYLRILERVSA